MATIRLADEGDARYCAEIYAPYVRDTAISFESSPPSPAEVEDRIEATLESHPWLVWERDGTVLGYAYAGRLRSRDAYQWSVESSVYVAQDHHRDGVATGLYESLFAVLRLQGYYNVYAGTTVPNPPSVGFHEAMGFEPVGVYRSVGYKGGEWHDVEWLHLQLQPPADDPDAPTPIVELEGTAALQDAVTTGLADGTA